MAIALIASFVLAAVAMFTVAARLVKRSPGPDVSTIAVLPFSDLGTESEGAQFARNLADAVSKTGTLHLTPASQAATLIEGSVQTSGDRLRVAVWLVRASDRRALWSQHYEFDANQAPRAQTNILRNVVHALHLEPSPSPLN